MSNGSAMLQWCESRLDGIALGIVHPVALSLTYSPLLLLLGTFDGYSSLHCSAIEHTYIDCIGPGFTGRSLFKNGFKDPVAHA